ncbi:MAG: hypothetical protein WBE26_01325, partial [Phycisphaerae bacterium]
NQARLDKLTSQLEQERAQYTEGLADIEKREEDVLALVEEADARCDAASTDLANASLNMMERHACHTAIARFWEDFNLNAQVVEDVELTQEGDAAADDTDTSEMGAGDLPVRADDAGETTVEADPVQEPVSDECPGDDDEQVIEADESQAAAMQAALASARAEIEAADDEPPPGLPAGAPPETDPSPPEPESSSSPYKVTSDLLATPTVDDKTSLAEESEPSLDLDPETANKLKLLRRLNPAKSQGELLAQITAEKTGKPETRQKRRKKWFTRS